MWWFSSWSKVQLPDWAFRSVGKEELHLQLATGRWLITDGGHLGGHIELGEIYASEATIITKRNSDGLQRLELLCKLAINYNGCTPVIVIDSGYIIVYCLDEFIGCGITNRTISKLLKAARQSCPVADTVSIKNNNGLCVGIIAVPPWGDGAYQILFDTIGFNIKVQINLESSL